MNLYCLQPNIIWQNKPANFDRITRLLTASPPAPGSLLLLPEMFATGFSMDVPAIAERDRGQTEGFLAATAAEFGIFIQAGLVYRDPSGKGLNQSLTFSPDGLPLARYTKRHPFSYSQEDLHYLPGADIITYPFHDATVCPFVCYDLRFPEDFRAAIRRNVHIFAVIACWTAAREAHWTTLLRARAIENQAYVLGCNRVGFDPNTAYSGRSLIIDPRGNILADAGNGETLISAPFDLPALLQYRAEFPALADMRPD